MKYIQDFGKSFAEINLIMKPASQVLSIFPHKGTWIEARCGGSFLQRFLWARKLCMIYGAGLHAIGRGHREANRSVIVLSHNFWSWLNKWIRYQNLNQIRAVFACYVADMRPDERKWLRERLGERGKNVRAHPRSVEILTLRSAAYPTISYATVHGTDV